MTQKFSIIHPCAINTERFTQYLRISEDTCTSKPIFHQNANPFVFGPRSGLDPQCDDFTLPKPTCWYPKNPADPTQTLADLSKPSMTQHEAQRKWWNMVAKLGPLGVWVHTGHVDFMLFVSFSFTLGCQQKRGFWWIMGFIRKMHARHN